MSKNDELRCGPPGGTAVHICVDMQRMFAEGTEWKMPWLDPVLPSILSITSTHPNRRSFTRFIPAQNRVGASECVALLRALGLMNIDQLSPEMLGQVPDLSEVRSPGPHLRQACVFALDRHRPATARRRDRYRHHHRRQEPMSACWRPCWARSTWASGSSS